MGWSDGYEYLSFVANFQSLKKKVAKEQISNLVKLFDLENEQEKSIKSLSSGTRMKVSLASALVHNPPILILDEPFVNLDIESQVLFKNILKLFKGKKTIVITSHNLDLVAELCDAFLIMDEGKIIHRIDTGETPNIEIIKTKIISLLNKKNQTIGFEWLL